MTKQNTTIAIIIVVFIVVILLFCYCCVLSQRSFTRPAPSNGHRTPQIHMNGSDGGHNPIRIPTPDDLEHGIIHEPGDPGHGLIHERRDVGHGQVRERPEPAHFRHGP